MESWPTIERRKHLRFPIRVPVTFVGGAARQAAVLVDLSEGGCYVATAPAVQRGWPVSLGIHAAYHGLCAATGTVVRVDERGFALEFADSNVALKNLIWDLEAMDEKGRVRVVAALGDGCVTAR